MTGKGKSTPRHLGALLVLLLGPAGWGPAQDATMVARRADAARPVATVSGNAFDVRDQVIVGRSAALVVLFQALASRLVTEAEMDGVAGYKCNLAPGVYETTIKTSADLVAYRRSRLLVGPGMSYILNLYPVQRTGVAMTLEGDIALPDPVVRYDTFYPDKAHLDLDLLVQYQDREESSTGVRYHGPFLIVTFDTLTLRAHACVLAKDTLRIIATDDVLVDLGQTRLRADRVELNSQDRVIRVSAADGVQEYHF